MATVQCFDHKTGSVTPIELVLDILETRLDFLQLSSLLNFPNSLPVFLHIAGKINEGSCLLLHL